MATSEVSSRTASVAAALGFAWTLAAHAAAGGTGEVPVLVPEASAETSCAAEMTARVQARYDGVQDLAANFTQRSESAALGTPQLSSGTVVFAKPGKMRWTYESPEPSIVVSDGSTLWMVDPEFKEVQVLQVDAGFLSGSAIHFLLGEGRLADSFEVTARDCGSPVVHLRLRPKEDATYVYVELETDAATGDLRATVLEDLLGNRTEVRLDSLLTNQGPSHEQFTYVPGPDERVLRLGQ